MRAYKIYFLDASGARSSGNQTTCESEDEAVSLAQRMLPDRLSTAEVWDGQTLVRVVGFPGQQDVDALTKRWAKTRKA